MSTTILLQCGRYEETEGADQVTVAVRVSGEGADLSELYARNYTVGRSDEPVHVNFISIPDSEYSQTFTDSLSLYRPAEDFLRNCFDKDFERVLGRTMTALEAEAILWDEEQFVVRTNTSCPEHPAGIRNLTLLKLPAAVDSSACPKLHRPQQHDGKASQQQ